MSAECCTVDNNNDLLKMSNDNSKSKISKEEFVRLFGPALFSTIVLLIGIFLDYFMKPAWFQGTVRLCWYVVAYIPVGFPVIKEALKSIATKDLFSEFFLMSLATIGAFSIGEYPEAVAVMLFYAVGEAFQNLAVKRAKGNIKSLLDQRPDMTTVVVNGEAKVVHAKTVEIGDVIQLRSGEKLALDSVLMSSKASFNTSALTGESKPDTKYEGDVVLAGMINLDSVCMVKVTTAYENSKLSRILNLIQEATLQKAPTELFIRKFARIYTPIVVLLAICICFVPSLFVADYIFSTWLYRALIFLVISCPCALVISIPLGYFGGIGAASRNGILFKGSNFLDKIAEVDTVIMDKTGTLTEGVFEVQEVIFDDDIDKDILLAYVNALESLSTHPIATAMEKYVGPIDSSIVIDNVSEIAGHGLTGSIEGKEILVGNFKLMDMHSIPYSVDHSSIVYTLLAVAYDGKFVGYITIADRIKEDAALAIQELKKLRIKTAMLSGDKSNVVDYVAEIVGVDLAYGDLLPEDKVQKLTSIKGKDGIVAFVGDGVNDAPVVALSDVGIAMGGLGSDATIETADVVIQDDQPSRIPTAIHIGKKTKQIVWQNIILAFTVKAIVLVLGADGLATMWEAVFADVGVALLAILNAIRIQRMSFSTER